MSFAHAQITDNPPLNVITVEGETGVEWKTDSDGATYLSIKTANPVTIKNWDINVPVDVYIVAESLAENLPVKLNLAGVNIKQTTGQFICPLINYGSTILEVQRGTTNRLGSSEYGIGVAPAPKGGTYASLTIENYGDEEQKVGELLTSSILADGENKTMLPITFDGPDITVDSSVFQDAPNTPTNSALLFGNQVDFHMISGNVVLQGGLKDDRGALEALPCIANAGALSLNFDMQGGNLTCNMLNYPGVGDIGSEGNDVIVGVNKFNVSGGVLNFNVPYNSIEHQKDPVFAIGFAQGAEVHPLTFINSTLNFNMLCVFENEGSSIPRTFSFDNCVIKQHAPAGTGEAANAIFFACDTGNLSFQNTSADIGIIVMDMNKAYPDTNQLIIKDSAIIAKFPAHSIYYQQDSPIQICSGNSSKSSISNSIVSTVTPSATTPGIYGISTLSGGMFFSGHYKNGGTATQSIVWDNEDVKSDDFKVGASASIPMDLEVVDTQKFGPANENVHISIDAGVTLTNYGTLYYPDNFSCEPAKSTNTEAGRILTEVSYNSDGGTPAPQSELLSCQEGQKKLTYANLPAVSKDGVEAAWYQDADKTKIADTTVTVNPNAHMLYADYITPDPGPIPPDPGPGPEPTPGDTITLTFKTEEGSWNGIVETTLEGAPDATIIAPVYPTVDASRTCIGWFDEQGKEIVSGVTKFSEVTGTVTARFVDTPSWHQNATGWWYVYDLNNNYYTNCWALINSAWFYFNDAGYCLEYTWGYIGGEWYFFGWGGYMQTGWQWISGSWYFLDRYTGAMKCGWVHDGVWYYCDAALGGAMYDNCWAYIGGYWYGFNEGGSMTQGWSYSYSYDGWFYLDPDTGHMLYGWQYIGGHWYYFYDNGLMAANTRIGTYRLGTDGAMW